MWYWKYEAEGQSHDLYYETGVAIRVRVRAIEFTKDQNSDDGSYLAPMIIHVGLFIYLRKY